jgi:hypothetical protein
LRKELETNGGEQTKGVEQKQEKIECFRNWG